MNLRPRELVRALRAAVLGLVLGAVLERLSLSGAGSGSRAGETGETGSSPRLR